MANLTGIKRYWAWFYDDRGEFIGKSRFSKYDSKFKFKNKQFNVIRDKATEVKLDYVLWEKRVYQYNINNPNPFILDKKHEPIINSEVYNIHLETKIIKDLNDLSKSGLSALLTPRNIIIALILIGIITYVATGHKIVPNS